MAGLGVAGLMIGLLLVGARHAVPFFVGQAFLPVLFVMPVLLVGPRCSCEHTNAHVSRYKVLAGPSSPASLPVRVGARFGLPAAGRRVPLREFDVAPNFSRHPPSVRTLC